MKQSLNVGAPVRFARVLIFSATLMFLMIGCESRSTTPPAAAPAPPPKVAPLPPQSELAEPTPIGQPATRRSGLVYESLKEGQGPMAAPGDLVTVHYTGTLEDGKVFDTSREGGTPKMFTLGERGLILGWNEGISGMRVGERRKLTLPPNVAYGALGNLPKVPPNATLVFDVELTKLEKAADEKDENEPAKPSGSDRHAPEPARSEK